MGVKYRGLYCMQWPVIYDWLPQYAMILSYLWLVSSQFDKLLSWQHVLLPDEISNQSDVPTHGLSLTAAYTSAPGIRLIHVESLPSQQFHHRLLQHLSCCLTPVMPTYHRVSGCNNAQPTLGVCWVWNNCKLSSHGSNSMSLNHHWDQTGQNVTKLLWTVQNDSTLLLNPPVKSPLVCNGLELLSVDRQMLHEANNCNFVRLLGSLHTPNDVKELHAAILHQRLTSQSPVHTEGFRHSTRPRPSSGSTLLHVAGYCT